MSHQGDNSTKCIKGCKESSLKPNSTGGNLDITTNNENEDKSILSDVQDALVQIDTPTSKETDKISVNVSSKTRSSKRCDQCRKKCGVMLFPCKCTLNFCMEHKYASSHNCKYDYKSEMQNKLLMRAERVCATQVIRF